MFKPGETPTHKSAAPNSLWNSMAESEDIGTLTGLIRNLDAPLDACRKSVQTLLSLGHPQEEVSQTQQAHAAYAAYFARNDLTAECGTNWVTANENQPRPALNTSVTSHYKNKTHNLGLCRTARSTEFLNGIIHALRHDNTVIANAMALEVLRNKNCTAAQAHAIVELIGQVALKVLAKVNRSDLGHVIDFQTNAADLNTACRINAPTARRRTLCRNTGTDQDWINAIANMRWLTWQAIKALVELRFTHANANTRTKLLAAFVARAEWQQEQEFSGIRECRQTLETVGAQLSNTDLDVLTELVAKPMGIDSFQATA